MVERVLAGPMHTNAYIYSEWKKECVVIDPGADPDLLISRLALINMKPRGILLTHGHIDHVSAAAKLKEHFGEKELILAVAIHENDCGYLGPAAFDSHRQSFGDAGDSGHEELDSAIPLLEDADILLQDGEMVFESDLKIIHTPGHTPGSICIYSESQALLFSGDTLLFEDVGRTDLPGGDSEALIRNIRERIFVLPQETRVFPGHGPFTTLERETRHNPFFN